MSEEIETVPTTETVIQTDDYYEFNIETDDYAAFESWNGVKEFLMMQGYTFLPDVQKRVNKWLKSRQKMFIFIHTHQHHDCKVVGLATYLESGNVMMHDVIAMTPVMEQPFRRILVNCLKDWALDAGIEVFVPRAIDEAISFEEKDTVTLDTAKNVFDIAEQEMSTTGTKTAVVTI